MASEGKGLLGWGLAIAAAVVGAFALFGGGSSTASSTGGLGPNAPPPPPAGQGGAPSFTDAQATAAASALTMLRTFGCGNPVADLAVTQAQTALGIVPTGCADAFTLSVLNAAAAMAANPVSYNPAPCNCGGSG